MDYIETYLKKNGAGGFTYDQIKKHCCASVLDGLDIGIRDYAELFKDQGVITIDQYKDVCLEKSTGKKMTLLLESLRERILKK